MLCTSLESQSTVGWLISHPNNFFLFHNLNLYNVKKLIFLRGLEILFSELVFKCDEVASRTSKDLNFVLLSSSSQWRQNLDKKSIPSREFPKNSQNFRFWKCPICYITISGRKLFWACCSWHLKLSTLHKCWSYKCKRSDLMLILVIFLKMGRNCNIFGGLSLKRCQNLECWIFTRWKSIRH